MGGLDELTAQGRLGENALSPTAMQFGPRVRRLLCASCPADQGQAAVQCDAIEGAQSRQCGWLDELTFGFECEIHDYLRNVEMCMGAKARAHSLEIRVQLFRRDRRAVLRGVLSDEATGRRQCTCH